MSVFVVLKLPEYSELHTISHSISISLFWCTTLTHKSWIIYSMFAKCCTWLSRIHTSNKTNRTPLNQSIFCYFNNEIKWRANEKLSWKDFVEQETFIVCEFGLSHFAKSYQTLISKYLKVSNLIWKSLHTSLILSSNYMKWSSDFAEWYHSSGLIFSEENW